MEDRYGVKGVEFDGVFFTEQEIGGAERIRHLHVEISLQNANLDRVKKSLARQAKAVNANVVMNFRYGQKAHSWLEQLFSFKWDTESWHGEGDAVRFSQ
ncbi:MAG: hypothetical protein WBV94_24715 [Blastocatellia bacterium]